MNTPEEVRAALHRFQKATGWYVADTNPRNGRCDLSLTVAQLDVITAKFVAWQDSQR